MLGSNEHSYRYSCSPRKYFKYGFIAISFATSSSKIPLYAGLISSALRTIRESIAACPFSLSKFFWYFRSNLSYGTSWLSRIQSSFGSNSSDPNISGDSSIDTCPVCRLYILSPPTVARFFPGFRVFLCTYYTMKWALSVVFSVFLVVCRRHYLSPFKV